MSSLHFGGDSEWSNTSNQPQFVHGFSPDFSDEEGSHNHPSPASEFNTPSFLQAPVLPSENDMNPSPVTALLPNTLEEAKMMKLEQATSLIDELEKCRKDNWHSLPPSLIAYQETVDEPNPEKTCNEREVEWYMYVLELKWQEKGAKRPKKDWDGNGELKSWRDGKSLVRKKYFKWKHNSSFVKHYITSTSERSKFAFVYVYRGGEGEDSSEEKELPAVPLPKRRKYEEDATATTEQSLEIVVGLQRKLSEHEREKSRQQDEIDALSSPSVKYLTEDYPEDLRNNIEAICIRVAAALFNNEMTTDIDEAGWIARIHLMHQVKTQEPRVSIYHLSKFYGVLNKLVEHNIFRQDSTGTRVRWNPHQPETVQNDNFP